MFNTAVKMSVIRSRVHGQPIRDVQLLSTCCQNMSVRARYWISKHAGKINVILTFKDCTKVFFFFCPFIYVVKNCNRRNFI